MLFAIDVVALTKDLHVLRVWHRLRPFRVTSVSLKIHNVLEIGVGEIVRCKIEVGDRLRYRAACRALYDVTLGCSIVRVSCFH